MALKGGLYSQVVMVHCSILKTKVTKENLVKDGDQKNKSDMNTQNKDENDMDGDLVKNKYKTHPSGDTEKTKEGENKSRIIRTNTSISMTVCNITPSV